MQRLVGTVAWWAPRCQLAESPRWHDGRWWWIDVPAGLVYVASAGGETDGAARVWLRVRGRVSLVHPAGPGSLLVAHGPVLRVYRCDGDGRTVPGPELATTPLPDGWLLNDGAADPAGGLHIGAVHPDRTPGSGYLQHIRADGRLADAVWGVGLSNGLALDPAGAVLFHADSTARHVLAHRLGDDGAIISSAVHLRFDPTDGMPDGLATDTAGGLWVAVYGAGQVRRYAPNGRLDLVVELPVHQVTSVALGGSDGHDLLITTAREGYDEARSAAEPLAGRLFSARSPYPARPLLSIGSPVGPRTAGRKRR